MKKILSILLLCFCFSATAQTNQDMIIGTWVIDSVDVSLIFEDGLIIPLNGEISSGYIVFSSDSLLMHFGDSLITSPYTFINESTISAIAPIVEYHTISEFNIVILDETNMILSSLAEGESDDINIVYYCTIIGDLVMGCTDADALNYNADANVDDESCLPYILGCTDEGFIEYNTLANTDDSSCTTIVVLGCTDINYAEYSVTANTDDYSCTTLIVEGCLNALYLEYSASANSDNGSCTILIVEGCQDSDYLEFNEEVTIEDGSCETIIIYGCMDTLAENYDSSVNYDPYLDICIYPGCTNAGYLEYTSIANVSDGSCTNLIVTAIQNLNNQVSELQNLVDSLVNSQNETQQTDSNANSFDVLNPLSYNGEFEAVSFTGDYTVPANMTLVIQHIHNSQNNTELLSINNIGIMDLYNSKIGGIENKRDFEIPILVGSLNTVNTNSKVFGILVTKNFNSITRIIGDTQYIVPEGSCLIMTHIYDDAGNTFFVDGEELAVIGDINNSGNITIPFYFKSGTTIESSGTQWPGNVSMHGILINESNYTYATDYELIDALNEGMDSLSTMSEIFIQENDSISSENAVLSEENEALMLIEYNYDSLQYVTEYLYSQVFDLQQELLVPNIDVDMAIGWNMIGFSCPEEKGATDALIDIVDEILIMKDNNGSVYMPEFGFNGIGDLTPGHGYQLKVTDYILDFNICE